jgi:hypothetical protein
LANLVVHICNPRYMEGGRSEASLSKSLKTI